MVSDAVNNQNDLAEADGERKSGNSDKVKENGDIESMNDGRMDESRCEIQVEQVCGGEEKVREIDEMVNKRDKGCLDSGSNRTEIDTYAKMVTQDLKIVDNKLSFVPTELNEEGGEIVIFDEAFMDKGNMQTDGTCMFKFRNEEGVNKVLELGPWIVNNKPLYSECVKRERSEEEIVMEAKRKNEISKIRNEENRERNNVGNHIGYRKYGERRQNKEGRFFTAGTKINKNKGSKGDVWKRKMRNEEKQEKNKNNEQEKKGKNKDEGDVIRNVNKFDALNDIEEGNDDLEKLKGNCG
ncbi:hypothetical protein Tco_0925574 [Tanacetum coccineum]|uniref:Uncharacterized protein n=1 Tax=Tanacetum coccineum TaxID=301880 RepID=A0ABQ5D8F8_9ASTR